MLRAKESRMITQFLIIQSRGILAPSRTEEFRALFFSLPTHSIMRNMPSSSHAKYQGALWGAGDFRGFRAPPRHGETPLHQTQPRPVACAHSIRSSQSARRRRAELRHARMQAGVRSAFQLAYAVHFGTNCRTWTRVVPRRGQHNRDSRMRRASSCALLCARDKSLGSGSSGGARSRKNCAPGRKWD